METIEKIIKGKNAPNSSKVLWLNTQDNTLRYQKGGWMPLNDESERVGNALSDIKDLKAQTEAQTESLNAEIESLKQQLEEQGNKLQEYKAYQDSIVYGPESTKLISGSVVSRFLEVSVNFHLGHTYTVRFWGEFLSQTDVTQDQITIYISHPTYRTNALPDEDGYYEFTATLDTIDVPTNNTYNYAVLIYAGIAGQTENNTLRIADLTIRDVTAEQ